MVNNINNNNILMVITMGYPKAQGVVRVCGPCYVSAYKVKSNNHY